MRRGVRRLGPLQLGLVELGLVELGLVELGLVDLGLVELGPVEPPKRPRAARPPRPDRAGPGRRTGRCRRLSPAGPARARSPPARPGDPAVRSSGGMRAVPRWPPTIRRRDTRRCRPPPARW